jgi:hypothetical protein
MDWLRWDEENYFKTFVFPPKKKAPWFQQGGTGDAYRAGNISGEGLREVTVSRENYSNHKVQTRNQVAMAGKYNEQTMPSKAMWQISSP